MTGDFEAGVADYGRALDAARATGDRRLQAEALDSLAFAEKSFDVERSGAHHHEALAIASELGDVPIQVRILSRIAIARANHLDLAGALSAGERALELAERTGDDHDRALAIDALKLTALQLGDLDRLETLTAELEELERRQGDLWYLQWTLLESSFVPLARARWDPATAKLEEALAINRRIGDVFCGPLIHDATCWLERSRGDLGRALSEGRIAVELTERAGPGPWSAWTRATLGWALLDLRAADDAVAVLERGVADAVALGDRFRAAAHLAWAHALTGDGACCREGRRRGGGGARQAGGPRRWRLRLRLRRGRRPGASPPRGGSAGARRGHTDSAARGRRSIWLARRVRIGIAGPRPLPGSAFRGGRCEDAPAPRNRSG